ncbi:MAG TPA: hypothetical protein VIG57_06320 [Candidatus Entotheonella sp.]|jgi:hypothetical protein
MLSRKQLTRAVATLALVGGTIAVASADHMMGRGMMDHMMMGGSDTGYWMGGMGMGGCGAMGRRMMGRMTMQSRMPRAADSSRLPEPASEGARNSSLSIALSATRFRVPGSILRLRGRRSFNA